MKKLLVLRTSLNGDKSFSNQLLDHLVAEARQRHPGLTVVERDLNADQVPMLNSQTVGAIRAGVDDTAERREAIALSNQLVEELKSADAIAIGLPRYNFTAPATFKSYIDYIGRAGITFRYTEQGPEGLLPNVPVYGIVASGGAYAGTDADQMSGWVKQVLGFLGLQRVELVHAERLAFDADASMADARQQISKLIAG